jgi:hypothetical protein
LIDPSPSIGSQPLQYNLLKLYRQHRDEIDTLVDPTTLFILDLTSHYGTVQLDELAGDLGLSPTALKIKIAPLLRGQMLIENDASVSVTALGKGLLDRIDFLPPLAVSLVAERPVTTAQKLLAATPAHAPSWLWGVAIFLGIAAVALLLILVIELVVLFQNPALQLLR